MKRKKEVTAKKSIPMLLKFKLFRNMIMDKYPNVDYPKNIN